MEWAKAGYHASQVSEKAFITTLEYKGTEGSYNIYGTDGEIDVVVFSDQKDLLSYVNDNIDSVFAIRLLKSDNNKYMYDVKGWGTVFTLARASVIVQGTLENPRRLGFDTVDGLITIT